MISQLVDFNTKVSVVEASRVNKASNDARVESLNAE